MKDLTSFICEQGIGYPKGLDKFIKERFSTAEIKYGWRKDDKIYWEPGEIEEPGSCLIELTIKKEDLYSYSELRSHEENQKAYKLKNVKILEVYAAIGLVAKEVSQFTFPDLKMSTDWEKDRQGLFCLTYEFSQGYGS